MSYQVLSSKFWVLNKDEIKKLWVLNKGKARNAGITWLTKGYIMIR